MAAVTALRRIAFAPGQVAPLFEHALSEGTNRIAHSIATLQNPPSPGTIKLKSSLAPDEQPLEKSFFDALAEAKILASQVAMHLTAEWRKRLFEQLDSLHDPAEWEAGSAPITQSSFSTFLKAILALKPSRRPALGLSHSGNLIASWTVGGDRLTIEFLPDDRVRWVLARLRDGERERFAGHTSVARLFEGLAPYQPQYWFSHES